MRGVALLAALLGFTAVVALPVLAPKLAHAQVCGDGTVDAGEECDDGNVLSGDCCSDTCAYEPAGSACEDDLNACTDDECDGGGTCTHPNNSDPCDDLIFCNGADTCAGGTCSLHAGDPCDGADGDGDCSETCDESADACTANDPNGSACTDSLFCNGTDTCNAGSCSQHTGDPCDGPDGDADCSESCNESTDTCTANDPNGSACTDSLFCNGTDTCNAGTCSQHAGDPCDGVDGDGDCSETCNESTDSCTANDPDGASCTDSLFCNGPDFCETGACTQHAGDPCDGPDGDADCSETCNESSDSCTANDPNGSACTDSLFCNGTDTCSAGSCSQHTGDPCDGPDGDADCAETCSESTDSCTANDPNGSTCTDSLFCNGTDTCNAGSCSHHTGDPCPGADGDADCSETCDESVDTCTGNDPNGSACTDSLFCNGTDTCNAGACSQHAGDPCPGADGDADCSETCNESTDACTTNDPNGSACSDSLFCNGADTCNAGLCSQHTGDPCDGPDDGDADCSETCNESADACTANDPNGSACSDGMFCNGADICQSGACSQHTGNPCAGPDGDADCSESCDEAVNTCTANDPNGSACSDSVFCNGADSCTTGACSQHAGDPCASGGECNDLCNESTDGCAEPAGLGCAPDGNACTIDECDGAGACAHSAGNMGAECRPAAGECDVADSCDGVSTGCPDVKSTAECRAAAHDCDGAESCDGVSDECPADSPAPDGTLCDDAVVCTIQDQCVAGDCQGDSNTCGDGTLQSSCNEQCDDGNLDVDDGCNATCHFEPCTPTPNPSCRPPFEPGRSRLRIEDDEDPERTLLQWKWNNGTGTSRFEFGTPLTTTSYYLCVYDAGALVSTTLIPAAGVCGNRACWSGTNSGFTYRDKERDPEGAASVKLKGGMNGKAKIGISAGGSLFELPTPASLQGPVVVQLVKASGVAPCWQTTFAAPFDRNDGTTLLDRD